jgi:hypothetical protein
MQGSLKSPPIVIACPRLKMAIGFVGSVIAVFAIKFWLHSSQSEIFFYILIFLFGAGLLLSPQLVLSPEGLCYGNKLSKKLWPWSDIDQFYAFQWPLLGFGVAWRFSSDYMRREEPFVNRLSEQKEGGLWPFWEIPTPELVSLLNKARQHWGTPAGPDSPLTSSS